MEAENRICWLGSNNVSLNGDAMNRDISDVVYKPLPDNIMIASEYDYRKAITVKELNEILKKYPDEMKCIFTWEGITIPIEKENIYISKDESLFFDADGNFYKSRFAK